MSTDLLPYDKFWKEDFSIISQFILVTICHLYLPYMMSYMGDSYVIWLHITSLIYDI